MFLIFGRIGNKNGEELGSVAYVKLLSFKTEFSVTFESHLHLLHVMLKERSISSQNWHRLFLT